MAETTVATPIKKESLFSESERKSPLMGQSIVPFSELGNLGFSFGGDTDSEFMSDTEDEGLYKTPSQLEMEQSRLSPTDFTKSSIRRESTRALLRDPSFLALFDFGEKDEDKKAGIDDKIERDISFYKHDRRVEAGGIALSKRKRRKEKVPFAIDTLLAHKRDVVNFQPDWRVISRRVQPVEGKRRQLESEDKLYDESLQAMISELEVRSPVGEEEVGPKLSISKRTSVYTEYLQKMLGPLLIAEIPNLNIDLCGPCRPCEKTEFK